MKLIVGLGNPGKPYSLTRHNLGFRCINHFSSRHGILVEKSSCRARIGIGEIYGMPLVLAKPQTFMNRSGEAVSGLIDRFGISLDDLLVVHDDLDLPLGKMRIRHDGGTGGHKGIESIVACLGSREFVRLRVGIGRPQDEDQDVISYVLQQFDLQDRELVETTITRVAEAVDCILDEGIVGAMNKFN
ncbi:MAG: aminoacyl-tRNA hydrolase [Chloroflexota bacterium]|nr:aminoacyl-tRNA hydrolase [Chloroflexota bacterium]